MTTRRTLLKSVAVVVLLTLAAAASGTPDRPIRAVAIFSILGDMVSRIGGEHVAVTTLVGSNGDMHVYRPTPSAARAVSKAHVLVVNGLDFEGWLDRLIEASDFNGVRVVATAGIEPVAVEDAGGDTHGHDASDPHAWQSLRNAVIYVDNITLALAKADPENASTFHRNRTAYVAELQAFDAEIRAVFPENVADPRLLKRIADEIEAATGGKLYPGALSDRDGPAPTYVDMMRHNARTLAQALLR